MSSVLITGIEDAAPIEEHRAHFEKAVEAIIPGAWSEFDAACTWAAATLRLEEQNKTALIRDVFRKARKHAEDLSEILRAMPPAGKQMVPAHCLEYVDEVAAMLTQANNHAADLPSGKQPAHHRDLLARDIAQIMQRAGIKPRLTRDCKTSDDYRSGGDTRFAALVRLAIKFVEGDCPTDFYTHLERGLALSEKPT